jgi:hypothetical protein
MVPTSCGCVVSVATSSPKPLLARLLHFIDVGELRIGVNLDYISFAADQGFGNFQDHHVGGLDEPDDRLLSVLPVSRRTRMKVVWTYPEDTLGPRIEKKLGKPLMATPL